MKSLLGGDRARPRFPGLARQGQYHRFTHEVTIFDPQPTSCRRVILPASARCAHGKSGDVRIRHCHPTLTRGAESDPGVVAGIACAGAHFHVIAVLAPAQPGHSTHLIIVTTRRSRVPSATSSTTYAPLA
jgi:hypothetical protein